MNDKFPEVLVIENKVIKDKRGYFFEASGFDLNFVQENVSFSHKNVLRGLHLQTAFASQGKLVRVVYGKIWDVVVDANICSPTYGQWAGIELDINNQIFIPRGFLHGFLALEESVVCYKLTNYYNKNAEKTIIWSDETLNIDWPIKDKSKLIISEKDSKGIRFKDL